MNFEQFQILGEEIHAKLRSANFDERALPDIASEALTRADLDTDFQFSEVADFLLTTNIQQQSTLQFSNLPPIVYYCEDFYIELLVWTDATTSIHQHSFSGAFRVLAGSSVHSIYEFDEHDRISSWLLLGDTRLKKVEILRTGDVRPIHPGRSGLLHALFHLGRPSVTLVVRNTRETWALPQYSLARPSVAYAHQELMQDSRVRLLGRLLTATASLNREEAVNLLVSRGTRLDFPRLFMVLMENRGLLGEDANWHRFMEAAQEVHGHLTDHLVQLAKLADCEASIVSTRANVTSPELRFFLALLLNVPSRTWISRLIQESFPANPPETLCYEWLKELSDEESLASAFHALAEKANLGQYKLGTRLRGAIHFGREDPRTEAILRAAVTGVSPLAFGARLQAAIGEDLASPEALEAYERLRQLAELAPLFTD